MPRIIGQSPGLGAALGRINSGFTRGDVMREAVSFGAAWTV
ncbi:MAG: hypothetical protein OXI30_04885 [Chloroflexota bacterium]|nr:hypothetical protein [Chloroflexota bacterium]